MKNRAFFWLLIFMVTVAAPFWWLLIYADRGVAPAKSVHIGELRVLAAILPGRRPFAVTYTVFATRKSTGDFYAAGIGLKRRQLANIAWTLPVPGKEPIMIDPGGSANDPFAGQSAAVDTAAQARIDATAKNASLVLHTQGHQNELPRTAYYLGKAGIGRASTVAGIQPASYLTAQAVAPGVVIIPASSHAPGAKLIFVQLADGREFLFTGNVAPFTENWLRLRARSHLAAIWGPAQDRAETYAWLRTIRQLRSEAPNLKIVPGSDFDWLAAQRNSGAISDWQPNSMPPGKAP